jgi:hypothetical protein
MTRLTIWVILFSRRWRGHIPRPLTPLSRPPRRDHADLTEIGVD